MEDVDGRLFVSERSVPTIEQKNKEESGHDRRGMENSRQKGTQNNMVVPRGVSRLKYFKGNNNRGFD